MDNSIKERIDSMSYKELLSCWRFTLIGDSMFQEENGKYFSKRMKELYPSNEEHIRISKEIGWRK